MHRYYCRKSITDAELENLDQNTVRVAQEQRICVLEELYGYTCTKPDPGLQTAQIQLLVANLQVL